LSNRVYLGDLCWNLSAHGKYHRVSEGEVTPLKGGRGRGKIQRNDPTDVIITPNAHPAIIDPDTFAACQKKLAQTRRGSPRCRSTPLPGGGDWVLSGLLYCGVCGGRMVGRIERRNYSGKSLVYRHYVCGSSWRKHAGGCHLNAVKQETIVIEVAKLIQQSFTDPERLALLRAEVERLTSQEEGDKEVERRRLTEALAELDAKINQGNENLLLLPSDRHPVLLTKLKEWEGRRAELARELSRFEAAADVHADYAQQVAAALEQVQHLEEKIRESPPDKVRDALAGLVERITLQFDYKPAFKNGNRPAVLTSLEVQLREEASGLLGDNLRSPARSTI
jgi:site-specific DNA recombinase